MLESHAFFTKMVDDLVVFSEYDPELADGIKWLDSQAVKKGILQRYRRMAGVQEILA